jgi:hypothetical protein
MEIAENVPLLQNAYKVFKNAMTIIAKKTLSENTI